MGLIESLMGNLIGIIALIIVAIIGFKILRNLLHVAILLIILALVLWFFGYISLPI